MVQDEFISSFFRCVCGVAIRGRCKLVGCLTGGGREDGNDGINYDEKKFVSGCVEQGEGSGDSPKVSCVGVTVTRHDINSIKATPSRLSLAISLLVDY
jgi:hypothetical protein